MKNPSDRKRTALLIHCTCDEAEQIRESAQREHRTVSGYVLHAVMSRIAIVERIRQPLPKTPTASQTSPSAKDRAARLKGAAHTASESSRKHKDEAENLRARVESVKIRIRQAKKKTRTTS